MAIKPRGYGRQVVAITDDIRRGGRLRSRTDLSRRQRLRSGSGPGSCGRRRCVGVEQRRRRHLQGRTVGTVHVGSLGHSSHRNRRQTVGRGWRRVIRPGHDRRRQGLLRYEPLPGPGRRGNGRRHGLDGSGGLRWSTARGRLGRRPGGCGQPACRNRQRRAGGDHADADQEPHTACNTAHVTLALCATDAGRMRRSTTMPPERPPRRPAAEAGGFNAGILARMGGTSHRACPWRPTGRIGAAVSYGSHEIPRRPWGSGLPVPVAGHFMRASCPSQLLGAQVFNLCVFLVRVGLACDSRRASRRIGGTRRRR